MTDIVDSTSQDRRFKITSLFAAVSAPALPVIVNAPIVLDAKTKEGVQGLLDYIRSLSTHKNTEVAQAEAERLQPYFSAMNVYLTQALEKTGVGMPEKAALKRLTTPGSLSKLFNAMADYTRSTLISDVVVMTDNIKTEGPASHLFREWNEFKTDYSFNGRSFNFGFLQVYEGGKKDKARSATTFPTFLIDRKMTSALHSEAEPVVRGLQSVMTLVNHDMLHHLTSTYIGGNTAFKPEDMRRWSYVDPVKEWARTIPRVSEGEAYEEWAQMGQEKVLLAPGNEALVEEVRVKVDQFMNGLERVRDRILREAGDPPPPEELRLAHDVVDYFGTTMAHALTRVFPLNHDIMQYCLDRMERLDPAPGATLLECTKMMAYPANVKDGSREELLSVLRSSGRVRSGTVSQIVKSYRDLGCDVYPSDDSQMGYKNIKMLQLIQLGGLQSHIPAIDDLGLTSIRENMARLTLSMVKAAATAAKFNT
ncbi:MAG: hypothetical protein ACAH83_07755 [Alphaproteobacteria bacterium]